MQRPARANPADTLTAVSVASGLLLLLDAHRLTGRLPVEIQIQVSRLRHAVKLAIQTQAASQTAVAPPPVRAEVDASPLAKTPYDLRHAALSTWLNGGVPPATVAEWAGHSVEVLLRTYAKCLDSGDALVRPPRPGGARYADTAGEALRGRTQIWVGSAPRGSGRRWRSRRRG